jgi:hypothetical protein
VSRITDLVLTVVLGPLIIYGIATTVIEILL